MASGPPATAAFTPAYGFLEGPRGEIAGAAFQKKRKRIEEGFGWLKTIALMRKVRPRGIHKVGWVFTFAAAAYNLVRRNGSSVTSGV